MDEDSGVRKQDDEKYKFKDERELFFDKELLFFWAQI